MRNERLLDVFAALLAVLGLALALVPVSATWEATLLTGTVTGTATCGPPVRAAFGQGIEPGAAAIEITTELPADVGPEQVLAPAVDAAVDACRGTATVQLLVGIACLLGAATWFGIRRHRALAPRRAARAAAWRAANPLGEERPLVRPGDVDWDAHDESFDVARDDDFEGVVRGEDVPGLPAPDVEPEVEPEVESDGVRDDPSDPGPSDDPAPGPPSP